MELCTLNSSFFNALVNNYLVFVLFFKLSEHLQICEVYLKISRCLKIKKKKKVVSGWELFLRSSATEQVF